MRTKIPYRVVSFCLLFSLLSCCTKETEKTAGEDVVRVDPRQEDIVSVDAVFESISIIPFDDSVPEALISSYKYKLVVTDDVFYVLDQRTCRIISFDTHGNWLQTADKKGRGKGEFLMSSDFRLDVSDSALLVLDPRGIVYKYSLEQGFPFKSQFAINGPLRSTYSLLPASNDEYLVFSESDDDHLGTIDLMSNEWNPFKYKYPNWLFGTAFSFAWTPFLLDGDNLYYYEGLDGTVYRVNLENRRLDRIISWDFGRFQFNAHNLEPNKEIDYYDDLWNENSNKWATPIHVEYITKQLVLARFYFDNCWKNLVYNRITKKCLCFSSFIEGGSFDVMTQYKQRGYLLAPSDIIGQIVDKETLQSTSAIDRLDATVNPVLIIFTPR